MILYITRHFTFYDNAFEIESKISNYGIRERPSAACGRCSSYPKTFDFLDTFRTHLDFICTFRVQLKATENSKLLALTLVLSLATFQ